MACGTLRVCEGLASAVNYGFDEIRFIAPVPTASGVRAHSTLTDVALRTDTKALVRHSTDLEIRGALKPAMTADWLALIF